VVGKRAGGWRQDTAEAHIYTGRQRACRVVSRGDGLPGACVAAWEWGTRGRVALVARATGHAVARRGWLRTLANGGSPCRAMGEALQNTAYVPGIQELRLSMLINSGGISDQFPCHVLCSVGDLLDVASRAFVSSKA
jgi:hypothetical protein